MHYKEKIAARAAKELKNGQIVNLGIGLPTLILEHLPAGVEVFVHSENGILGMGKRCREEEADPMLIDSGGSYIFSRTGASFFDSALSFSLVRGGRLDVAVLGTLEVAENGDLANWIIPGKFAPGIGGGMELAQKARRLIVTTAHTTRKGDPKILPECTLPVTAKGCVDLIITELAVFAVEDKRLFLRELAREADLDDVLEKTGAEVVVPQGDIPVF
ncbi:MAG: 3-oxoacid CoA-transferase subunit B [Desulfonatronovibrionaceae bacterium]